VSKLVAENICINIERFQQIILVDLAMLEYATAPIVRNVKIRFVICPTAIKHLKETLQYLEEESQCYPPYVTYRKTGNYVSLKNYLSYTIWPEVGKVNITGIKSLEEIDPAITDFCFLFKIKRIEINNVITDNIFACGSFNRRIDLRALKLLVNSLPKTPEDRFRFFCEYIPEKFGAAYCRSRKEKLRRGTVIVFGSGKYNILGAKCRVDIANLFQEMNAITLKL
jgi:TATA-box binding protein (TBP) (component of TFIID and TFIIIB)